VSKTETKATYAMARTLAQLARVHLAEKQAEAARSAFAVAQTAFTNARTEPPLCRDFPDFGGEGGIYPDNDVYALWREPRKDREPCHPGRDNIEDDAYSALVEMFLASRALADPGTAALAKQVAAHPRFGEIDEFWWMSVAPTANLSLLTLPPEGIDLGPIRKGLFTYADACVKHGRRLPGRDQGRALRPMGQRRQGQRGQQLAVGLEPAAPRRRDRPGRRRRGEGPSG
jgi:hypothetical protein